MFAGSHYKKFYKKARPIVQKINELEKQYQSLSDEQLKAKTLEFKKRYADGESLDSILPEAFATVKNAARRLCGKKITVCGHEIEWQMVHYDVQLIGGMALHKNMIAEMATGEGKTLVATLPLYLNAITGKGCHLVTVNEYLAKRDSEWMGYLYNFLGLSVSWIYNMQDMEEKAKAYQADITYGTASEFGFDYLRDNGMASSVQTQVQRGHYFCIVDEVDSILIDEARTPLIISGPVQDDREPRPDEIAREMGISEEKVREIIKVAQEPVSLETPIGEEEDSHLGDFIPDDDAPAPAEVAAFTLLKEQLMEVLDTLTPREEKVLRLRFGLDDGKARTLEEVGREFNVTRERIRQIEAKALRKLRHPSRSKKLKDFLE